MTTYYFDRLIPVKKETCAIGELVMEGTTLPNEEVDEDEDGEEEATPARAPAQHQNQVAGSAEQQHPQRVEVKEQEKAVKAGRRRRHVLHCGGNSWKTPRKKQKTKP